jgi:hypothetical protein
MECGCNPARRAFVQHYDTGDERPGLAAAALARLLDNTLALPQHPAAAGRLVEILGRLSKGAQRRGKLFAVKALTSSAETAQISESRS